jgi:putative transposase
MVEENMNKKKRRKWVRYEREYSMSLWQGDWKMLGEKWIIAFMDDASRFITCYGIFDNATTENTIKVLREGFAEYGIPDEILTDHGTQFVAAKNREKAKHKFKEFLKENGIRHILARVNHPQTNGKIESWFVGAENLSF